MEIGGPLLRQLSRERDPETAVHLVRALRHYPSRETVGELVELIQTSDLNLRLNSQETLVALTGLAPFEEPEQWQEWWETTGKMLWP